MKVNKKNFDTLEKEKDMLRLTLDHLVQENLEIKQINEDMKITLKHNKDMLKEYIESITNKDKVVKKLMSQIDNLNERLDAACQYIKKLKNNSEILETKSIKRNLTSISQSINKTENLDNNSTSIYQCKTSNDIYGKNLLRKSDKNHNCSNCQTYLKHLKDDLFCKLQMLTIEIEELNEIINHNNNHKENCNQGNKSFNLHYSFNENQLCNLNHSYISKTSSNLMKNKQGFKINLKNKFDALGLSGLKNILENFDEAGNNLIIMQDSNNNYWELVRRKEIKEINKNNFKLLKSINENNLCDNNKNLRNSVSKFPGMVNIFDNSKLEDFEISIINNIEDGLID